MLGRGVWDIFFYPACEVGVRMDWHASTAILMSGCSDVYLASGAEGTSGHSDCYLCFEWAYMGFDEGGPLSWCIWVVHGE